MATSALLTVYAIGLAETFLGLVANAFITISNVLDWKAGKKLKPFDKIFLSLGLSRSIHMCLLIFNIIIRVFNLNVYGISALNWILNLTYLFLDFSSLWFAMWLCFLYFVKVTIFKNTLLIRIKLRIPQLVLYMIISSILMALLSGFIFVCNYNDPLDLMFPRFDPQSNSSIEKEIMFLVPSYFLGHFLPFIMVSISTTFLLRTIVGHVTRIKSTITSFTTPKMDAHFTAIRSVCLVEFMTICYFIVTVLLRFNFYQTFNNNVIFVLVIFYPTFHSMVLIAGNAKLKKKFFKIVYYVKKCEPMGSICSILKKPK
ncbi:taste receptor type 2 member 9-like [Aquarana catesbeiana]|uniref:taste receptor type 2 member 9-like n=1 Tax=Aquarana catesbeiana TaxID=8400 RepID=UPI003CCA3C1B